MKKLLTITLILVFTLVGCSSENELPVFSFGTGEIDGYIKLSPNSAKEYFFFDEKDIDSSLIYISEDSMKADEVVVLKAVDESALKRLVICLENRIEAQRSSFKGYAPEEYEKLCEAKVLTSGLICYYAVGGGQDAYAQFSAFSS